jgi:membrane glycosyltransferase
VSPALLGLFLAVPLSRASGSESLGRALSRIALLRTPEEVDQPGLVARRTELMPARARCPRTDCVIWRAIARHASRTSTVIWRGPCDPRGKPDPHAFTARAES